MQFSKVVVFVSMLLSGIYAHALTLAVQPINTPEVTKRNYQPLAEYLQKVTGLPIKLKISTNFLSYWIAMRKKNHFDLIIDAAHFVDYRAHKMHYQVIASFPNKVSYSLVSSDQELFLDREELISKKVAVVSSPNLGGLLLREMYPSVVQTPVYVDAKSSQQAVEMLKSGRVKAAMIPTPMVQSIEGISVIETTEPVEPPGFSVSPKVSEADRKKLQDALLKAKDTPAGKKALQAATLTEFIKAENKQYNGYRRYLRETWGY